MSARSRIAGWLQLDPAGEFQGESGILERSQCFSNPVTNVTCYGLSLERGLVNPQALSSVWACKQSVLVDQLDQGQSSKKSCRRGPW